MVLVFFRSFSYQCLYLATFFDLMQPTRHCKNQAGSFEIRHGTLGSNKHWPHDIAFDVHHRSTNGLEWLVEDENDIVVVGLLLREFGKTAASMCIITILCRAGPTSSRL